MASATQSPGLGARIGEYFTLKAAAATQARLGEPARKAIEGALALGRQRAEGAEALWSNGHTAEALRLAVQALLETVKAAPAYGGALGIGADEPAPAGDAKADAQASADAHKDDVEKTHEKADAAAEAKAADAGSSDGGSPDAGSPDAGSSDGGSPDANASTETKDAAPADSDARALADAEGKPAEKSGAAPMPPKKDEPKKPVSLPDEPWSRALAARGVVAARVEKAKVAVAAARAATLPLLDAEVSPASAELYEQVLDARHTIDKAFALVALPPRDLGWTRFSRIGTTVLVLSIVVLGLVLTTRQPEGIFADASDSWNQSPTFAPELAIDGRDDTYWLLPDGATGWVEARISPPIHIEHVRLLNTHNPPHDDRATNEYTLEVYSGGEVAQRIEGSFEFSRNPAPVTHDVSVDGVERIRFVVRSHHNVGAGLADLSWD